MAPPRRKTKLELHDVYMTTPQLELLRKLNFPGTQEDLAHPVHREDGMCLPMTRPALEALVGWVAGQANHERSERRAEMLNDIADDMEALLRTLPPRA